MIRKFFTLLVFSSTVTCAVFGQRVFGHDQILAWAGRIQHDGPKHVEIALRQTDRVLAQLAPQAGEENPICINDMPVWMAQIDQPYIMSISHTRI